MKRWNGWGDDHTYLPVSAETRDFLHTALGPATPPRDVPLTHVTELVPKSRLPHHALVLTSAEVRARHARGQSFPDLIATRSGRDLAFPDGVAFPQNTDDVRDLMRYATHAGAVIIPYGGGTSVAGHVNPPATLRPVLTISLERMNQLLHHDDASQLATFQAGVTGADLEAALRARGHTLGHFPQSFEYSTLGGWVATRSSGQQSLRYGRIEELFAGGTVVTPSGDLKLAPFPASAAGPDLRHVILGSEGRAGILTEAVVRVSRLPDVERFEAAFFPDWASGTATVRSLAQARVPLSMLRLSTPNETTTNLILAGHRAAVRALETYLSVRGVRNGRCMLVFGVTGTRADAKFASARAGAIIAQHGGVRVGPKLGAAWHKGRFRTPYLRNSLWEAGYGVDTLETATTWDRVDATLEAVESALRGALAGEGERVHVFTHLSHVYRSGSSLYTTFVFRLASTPDETLRRWQLLKHAASTAIVRTGATISHQHGVGRDHAPYLASEKGALGMRVLRSALSPLDPTGSLNPGALLHEEADAPA